MKKNFTLLVLCFSLGITFGLTQNSGNSANQSNKYASPASPIDNIGHWMEMAHDGVVPYNTAIPVAPAEYFISKSGSNSVDQMSTDVCVWDETGVTQSENSIAASPVGANTVINSNNSESGGSIYGANYINSYSSGSSWSGSKLGAGGTNKGDPAAAIGPTGRRYIGFITSNRGQGIAYSDYGTTWTPVALTGAFSYPDLMDKNHLTVDPRLSGIYSGYVYSAWTHFETGNANDGEIEFSRSTNNGVSWSTPFQISSGVSVGNHNQGVNLQTGPSGQVYAVWTMYDVWGATYHENAIGFARSLNGGSSFYSATRIHNNIHGIRPSPYTPTSNVTGKNMRCNSFPSMAVDISGGPYNGYIYVVWANVGTPGTNTGTNVSIYCMRSTNGGVSWGTPVRVNQGTSANDYASFFPWISCDPATGRLFCVFYDDRNLGSTSTAVETWMAFSEDGGLTWDDIRVGDVSFTPAPIAGLAGGYMGDYLGISARDGWVYPCWTDNRSGRALTYVSPINFGDYCIATGGCDEYISNVNFGTINNSSACEGYSNFTNLSNDVFIGTPQTITVTNGVTAYSSDQCGIWVDWNRDGDFSDANETISVSGTPGVGPYTASISPPTGTLQGPTTLRVRITYTGAVDPCGSTTFGEVEDYTINVLKYCAASGGCDEYISNVQIGTINNSSGCDGYHDYSNLSTNIDVNSSATLTVTNGAPWAADQCGVWVDWNKDNDFLDANETIAVSGTPSVGPYTALIDPPTGVFASSYTMRVRITYTGTVSSCGPTSFGEVEDYTINVTGPNTWIGVYNHYWHNSNNWSTGHIPIAGEDVNIPNIGYQPVYIDFYDEACTNLNIGSGAVLNIYDQELIVNGNLEINGQLGMLDALGVLRNYGSVVWQSGSTANFTANSVFWVYGNWNFSAGANANLANGIVDFTGTGTSWIRQYSTNSSFNTIGVYKSGADWARISDLSSQPLTINGSIYIQPSCNFGISSSQNVIFKGSLYNNGNYDFTGASNTGWVIFDGTSQQVNHYTTGTGLFNNVRFSSSTGTTALSNITVAKNLTIDQGYFSPGATTVTVGGNWSNTVGTAGFLEGTSRVIFNGGAYHQYCSNETFNILEVNKAAGGAFRPYSGENIVCAAYDWTAGALDVITGSFTANNLLDNGIAGVFYNNAGGTINLTNSSSGWVDLNGELHIYGGTFNVYGTVSDWPYSANATIEMSGGILDFKTCGISINNSSYSLTDNITGGTIRSAYGFSGNRADFTPTAGTFEFYGLNDSYLYESNGCTIPNVVINKSSKGSISKVEQPLFLSEDSRTDLTKGPGAKTNSIILSSNFTITNDLDIQAGTFDLSIYQCTVAGTTNIEGTLAISQATADLTTDNIFWNSGSNDNVTAGTIHAHSWKFNDGTNAQLGIGNTAFVWNLYYPTDADAEFGNLVAVPYSKGGGLSGDAIYPITVSGNFTSQSGASWSLTGVDLNVTGNAEIQDGSSLYFGSSGDFNVGGTLNLAGDLTLYTDCIATIHGIPSFATTSGLYIYGGSFISDGPNHPDKGWEYLNGSLTMTSGLFEITNNSIRFNSTAINNISGGILRTGGAFYGYYTGTFQPTGGVVEVIGSQPDNSIYCANGNYFYDLLINRDPGVTVYLTYTTTILNDLTIQNGVLDRYGDIYIGGDWTNNVGPTGFTEGLGTVFFNGDGALNHQFINGSETFYNLTNAKTGGGHLDIVGPVTVSNTYLANGVNIISGSALTVNGLLNLSAGELGLSTSAPTVNVNNFTMGGIFSVTAGNFNCTDITNAGLYGTINIYGGITNIHQDAAQYVDLNANLTISGGALNVYGNFGANSVWPYTNDASITMSNGILDFKEAGIYIGTSHNLIENITGGTIRTVGTCAISRNDFSPTGGTFELYGGNDAPIYTIPGSNFYNLTINKSGGVDNLVIVNEYNTDISLSNTQQPQLGQSGISSDPNRPKMPENLTDANTAYTFGDVLINGTTTVDEGTFRVQNYAATCLNNININSGGILNIEQLGTLKVGSSRILTVNNGGVLNLTGSSVNPAILTHNSGNYGLNIESGGIIGAEYGIFEYMSTAGVYIKSGAIVDPAKTFNNCTFRNGQNGGRLMTINNNQTFNVNDAVFPVNVTSPTYNVYKSVNVGTVNFLNATGAFSGESFEYDPYNRVNWAVPAVTYNLTVFLEGPFDPATNKMKTDLNGIIPTSQPYFPAIPYFGNPMPDWYYGGAESVGVIPNIYIVDWIVVQLREGTSPATATTVLASQAAFVNNMGMVVGMDGLNPLNFAVSYSANLYAVIWHRNHLGIISANPLVEAGGNVTYNFSSGSGQALGGTSAQKLLATGIWGMMSGDGDGSGTVLNSDRDNVWDIQAGTVGYKAADFNMNRQVNNPDKDDKWVPNLGKGSFIPE